MVIKGHALRLSTQKGHLNHMLPNLSVGAKIIPGLAFAMRCANRKSCQEYFSLSKSEYYAALRALMHHIVSRESEGAQGVQGAQGAQLPQPRGLDVTVHGDLMGFDRGSGGQFSRFDEEAHIPIRPPSPKSDSGISNDSLLQRRFFMHDRYPQPTPEPHPGPAQGGAREKQGGAWPASDLLSRTFDKEITSRDRRESDTASILSDRQSVNSRRAPYIPNQLI